MMVRRRGVINLIFDPVGQVAVLGQDLEAEVAQKGFVAVELAIDPTHAVGELINQLAWDKCSLDRRHCVSSKLGNW